MNKANIKESLDLVNEALSNLPSVDGSIRISLDTLLQAQIILELRKLRKAIDKNG